MKLAQHAYTQLQPRAAVKKRNRESGRTFERARGPIPVGTATRLCQHCKTQSTCGNTLGPPFGKCLVGFHAQQAARLPSSRPGSWLIQTAPDDLQVNCLVLLCSSTTRGTESWFASMCPRLAPYSAARAALHLTQPSEAAERYTKKRCFLVLCKRSRIVGRAPCWNGLCACHILYTGTFEPGSHQLSNWNHARRTPDSWRVHKAVNAGVASMPSAILENLNLRCMRCSR